jgi:serine/threonine-protein kinase RsbW
VSEVETDGLVQPQVLREVDVRVAADAEQVALLRAFAASIAIRLDFDVDAIDDFRMAVDEACSLLVGVADPGGSLYCTFQPGSDAVTVQVAVDAPSPVPPSADTLSWHILTSLTASLTEHVTSGPDGHRVAIELSSTSSSNR